jgi:hypothetical protein
MTITQILEDVREFKACSVSQLKRHLRKLNIQPIGCRQRPQPYPDDAAKRILAHLGVPLSGGPVVPKTNGAAHGPDDGKVVSLRKLGTVRAKAGRAVASK